MTLVLSKINALRPYTYQINDLKIGAILNLPIMDFWRRMTIFPHLVTHDIDRDRPLDVYSLDYSGFSVIAIKAIQELQERIDLLEKRLNQLESFQQRQ